MRILTNRSTPLKGITVYPRIRVELSAEEVDHIFYSRLTDLIEESYVDQNGKLHQHIGTHPHNGDEMYEEVGSVDDPKVAKEWAIPIAAYRLRRAIMNTAI